MAKATPCPVPEGLSAVLSGYDFADSFQIVVSAGRFDARSAAHQALDQGPLWVGTLLGLRNLLVAPFGLRGTGDAGPEPRIGWFPLVSESPERVVLGFDDKHLDFRIVIDWEAGKTGQDIVRASTLVRRHNLGGRLYLASIMPFHKVIVPHMLKKLG